MTDRRHLVVAVLFAVTIAGCGPDAPEPDASRAVAAKFLEEIRAGKGADAWQSTTAEFKSASGKESFLRDVGADKSLKAAVSFVSQQSVRVQGQDRPELLFRTPNGTEIRIVLGLEAGVWKVDRWTHH
ncbi:MAG TPA: hypothetical protein VM510_01825 [Caulifigura sp.]|jgi:hypothetical protein|nr:hypothetical protein [Caulifigura sp.]